MKTITTFALIAAVSLVLPAASNAEQTKEVKKTHKADTDTYWSNWPHQPERQGGRAYSKRTRIEYGGPVERNFESGRR